MRMLAVISAALDGAAGCGDGSIVSGVDAKPQPGDRGYTVYRQVNAPAVSFLLFADGKFQLRHGSDGVLPGTFTRTGSKITFAFWSTRPDWCTAAWCEQAIAVGNIRDNMLIVQYDDASSWLQCSDIIDVDVCTTSSGTYVRSQ